MVFYCFFFKFDFACFAVGKIEKRRFPILNDDYLLRAGGCIFSNDDHSGSNRRTFVIAQSICKVILTPSR